jgi:hypothetical protein
VWLRLLRKFSRVRESAVERRERFTHQNISGHVSSLLQPPERGMADDRSRYTRKHCALGVQTSARVFRRSGCDQRVRHAARFTSRGGWELT